MRPDMAEVITKVEHLVSLSGSGTANVIDSTTYHYEDSNYRHLLTGITDSKGVRYATFAYDTEGRAILTKHAGDIEAYQIEYANPTATTKVTTVTNPLGKKSVYTFNKSDNYWLLASINGQASANCVSSNLTYTYAGKLPASVTDEEGRVTTFTRNSAGLPTTIVQASGTPNARTTTLTWRADRKLDLKQVAGLTTDYIYNANGQLTGITETDTTTHTSPYATSGQTRSWTYTYTAQGLLASVDGPLSGTGDKTTYSYSTAGALASVTSPMSLTTTINSSDPNGRPLTVTDPNGVVRSLTYTQDGYLASVTLDPSGANVVTTLTYDAVGQLTGVQRADGSSYIMAYDNARRLTSVTDANGSVITYAHNSLGGVTQSQIKNASAAVVYTRTNTFDELGRLIQSVGASTNVWKFAYDKVGNNTSVTDPRNGVITTAFNGLNEVISTIDQASKSQAFSRNGQGDITTYTDGRSIATNYVRNGWGEIIRETSPDIGSVVYQRNAQGLVTKKTDARNVVANYTYDALGRLKTIVYPAATVENVTYSYDSTAGGNLGKGHLTGVVDQVGTTARTYNSLGLIASESLTLLGQTATTSYTYGAAGNLASVVYPSGRIISYQRNTKGEVVGITMRAYAGAPLEQVISGAQYHAFGDVSTFLYGNGLGLHHNLDLDYRVQQIAVKNGTTTIGGRTYSYGDKLNITQIQDNVDATGNQSFSYAANNILNQAVGPWGTESFTVDAAGNRTLRTLVASGVTTQDQLTYGSGNNRLATITRNSASYRTFTSDAAGNLLTDKIGTATTTYGYNNANRLRTVTKAGLAVAEYTYNAFGQLIIRRITNTAANGDTVYLYDQDGRIMSEHDGVSGLVRREYVWLNDKPVAIVDTAGSTNTTYYVHADHLNRPISLTDANKSVVGYYNWLAFGGLHNFTGTKGIDLRFPGQMVQAETGLHYNWNRHYDPTTGRYTQPDPLGLVDAPSRYSYVRHDPLQITDPAGLQNIWPSENAFVGAGQLPYEYDPRITPKDLGGNAPSDANHNFPTSYDLEVCMMGTLGAVGVANKLGEPGIYVQKNLPGTLNQKEGVYEVGVEYPINPFSNRDPLVTHRFFRSN